MMRRIGAAAVALLIVAGAAYAAYPLKVKDARGKKVTVGAKPMRVVSLAPNVTEILYAVGLRGRLVGVTKYCDYPAYVRSKPKVGDMTSNLEAVLALKPDLVVADALVNESAIARLEKLGPPVYSINPKTLAQVAADIRSIGTIVARPKSADGVARKLERAVSEVRAERKGKPVRTVLVVIQSNPLWVAGPKTLVDEMLRVANARNVAGDARPGYNTFSSELAISRSPDIIIVGLNSDREYFLMSRAWRNTKAVRNKRIYVIDNDLLVRPGPRLAVGLRQLAQRLD